jgi:hypothetical protein
VEHVARLPHLSAGERTAVLGGNAAELFGVRL